MAEKQLLIESCDFSFNCNLSEEKRNALTESLKISAGKNGNLIVKSVPCTILDRRNQNNRIYPTALVQKAINEAKPKMKNKMLLCSYSEHPESSFVEPKNISHCVINAYIKNVEIEVEGKKERHNVLFNDWEILNEKSPAGAQAQQLLLSGFGVGTSIRSLGSCDSDGTVIELEYLGTDLVGQPSSSTYVNSVIGESVSVSAAPLTETFVVSTSSTDVVRDLEQAAILQNEIDNAKYGTIKKTSTKLESEVDPKTGAETTMVTLETETEDEVSELDQALIMAKQAMTNGKANIDSVTIENVKEEQQKESVENKDDEKTLNEDNDWIEGDKNLFKTLYHLENGNIDKNGTHFEFVPLDDENVKITTSTLMKKPDGSNEIISNNEVVSKDKARTYWHKLKASGLYDYEKTEEFEDEYVPESAVEESTITEAKENKQEDPNDGKQFVLKTKQGFVSMDGNTLTFVEKPKDAIHFVKGKEESGVVHLSGIMKILETMGIYDTEKYYKKGITDISVQDDVNVLATNVKTDNKDDSNKEKSVEESNQTIITEDNGSNTKYQAIVEIEGPNGNSTDTVPVSAVDQEGINAEVGNLYDMKAQKADGKLTVKMVDTSTNEQFIFNPETRQVEPLQTQQESIGEIEQNGNKLSMEVDDDNKVEKEFKTPEQASVVKAGIEKGQFGGDVLLPESDEENSDGMIACEWCGEKFEPTEMKKEVDLGWMCPQCRRAVASRVDDELFFTDNAKMDEVMYKKPSEASDPYIEKPLNEEEKTFGDLFDGDKEPLLLDVSFKDIDWDNEDLVNNFTNNAEADDLVNMGDIESKIRDLPDEASITVDLMELPSSDDALERALFDKLGEKYSMKVNKAVIKSINHAA